ncbi:MAG: hypothetical protein ABSD64_13220, partial [Terriglobales bacterium]
MKILLFAGLLLVVLGIASLVVPIPHNETHGIKAGDMNIGVQTSHSERVSPMVSVVLIAGGIALAIAGTRTPLSSTLLKNYSQSTAVYVTKKHARSRRSAEPYIQLLVAGGTG